MNRYGPRLGLYTEVALTAILLLPVIGYADDRVSTAAAESLLAAPADEGWNLGAMMQAQPVRHISNNSPAEHGGNHSTGQTRPVRKADDHHAHDEMQALKTEVASLRQQSALLKAELATARQSASVSTAPASGTIQPGGPDSGEITRLKQQSAGLAAQVAQLKSDLKISQQSLSVAQNQVSSLKDGLAERDRSLTDLTRARDTLNGQFATAQDAVRRTAEELKTASANLVRLKDEQRHAMQPDLTSPQQVQGYVAGITMAGYLHERLSGWQAAGVTPDAKTFRAGVVDGLINHPRLPEAEAKVAWEKFSRAIQQGVTQKVAQAERQLNTLARGRRALKVQNGITWYRVRTGKTVPEGAPVRLSMTEKVAGGRTVSTVPPMLLRPGDEIPSVVKDGMSLPGTGGEVVGYALARSIYGPLPLPRDIQPWTVMEYHLKGEPSG